MSADKRKLTPGTQPKHSPKVPALLGSFRFSDELKALIEQGNEMFASDNASLIDMIRNDLVLNVSSQYRLLSSDERLLSLSTLQKVLSDLGDDKFVEFIKALCFEAQLRTLIKKELDAL